MIDARRKTHSRTAATVLLLVLAPGLHAAEDSAPESRPLLTQLNRETEGLYRDVRRGLLRVQLPPAPREGAAESPLTKYKELDPKVREALARGNAAPPGNRSATDAEVQFDAGASVIVVPPPAPAAGSNSADAAFAPNNVGLLLDEKGYVLVPQYVDPVAAGSQSPVSLAGPDGRVSPARFVGSDRQTGLTVLQLPKSGGTPLRLADSDRPAEGALVMLVAPTDSSAKMGLWTGGGREMAVVFSVDGTCSGVARYGQFLSARACRLIADQIIRYGSVKRATLGVIITEIRKDDPLRQQVPVLGDRTAMRIDQVMPGSAAEKAGLRGGDLLLALAGESVSDIPSFSAAIANRSGPTEFQVLRGGEALTVTVDLQQK